MATLIIEPCIEQYTNPHLQVSEMRLLVSEGSTTKVYMSFDKIVSTKGKEQNAFIPPALLCCHLRLDDARCLHGMLAAAIKEVEDYENYNMLRDLKNED